MVSRRDVAMDRVWYLFICLCILQTVSGACRTGEFFNFHKQACDLCSKCPPNKIIKHPCTDTKDVECKPFREFRTFNQLQEEEKSKALLTRTSDNEGSDPLIRIEEIPTITKDEGEYWRNLAFALIGVLCALIVVATIIVLCACRKLHESVALKRPEEDDCDDTDNGYVVIRQIRQFPPPGGSRSCSAIPSSSSFTSTRHQRMPWLYRPKRRLLNEYVDDVFESEDSAGSRTSRKQPLTVIHERESEGRNSCESV